MKRLDYLFQYLAALVVFGVCSFWIRSPGYMDAEYYMLSAVQMVEGKGMTQPILWNYLDDPAGLPHPSHTYWMPAPSLVAASGMMLTGRTDFVAGRFLFIFLSALAAPMSGWMGYRLGRERITAWLAAGLAVFSGYFAVYASTIDSFYLVMLAVWTILVCLDRILSNPDNRLGWMWFVSGLAAGWMHLNRADGMLWLLLIFLTGFIQIMKFKKSKSMKQFLLLLGLSLTGYLVVTGFWYYRNLIEFGSLFIPGSSRALWVNSYDELFMFPAAGLTFEHWLGNGVVKILTDRMEAVGSVLLTVFGVQGMVFLLPFWIIAFYQLRHERLVQIGLGMEIVLFLVMTVVFPYSGKRGGFLHSSAALQPFLWGLAAYGFASFINRVSVKRHWEPTRALKMFAPGIVLICLAATLFIFQILVIGPDAAQPVWDDSYRQAVVARDLVERNAILSNTRIMINNPAGFSLISGRESIVIPFGDAVTLSQTAESFESDYVVLEKNIVSGLMDLYLFPERYPQFTVMDRMDDKILLQIKNEKGIMQ